MTVLDPEKSTCDLSENSVHQYMQEIRQVPRLTPEQELQLAKACADGDSEAIRQMVSANLQLVVSIAREYAGRGVPLLDLVQEGSIGLIYAARKFDYTRQLRFSTYATKWIRQGVARCVMDHNGLIRIPHYTAEKMNKVLRAKMELTQAEGHTPEINQIAERCEMEPEKVTELLGLYPQVYSLDTPVGSDGEDELQVLIENLHSPQPQEELVRRELKNTLETLLSMLNDRQQEVLRLRYGLADGECWSTQKIAEKMGVCRERIRQVEQGAIRKLKKMGADFGLEDFLE